MLSLYYLIRTLVKVVQLVRLFTFYYHEAVGRMSYCSYYLCMVLYSIELAPTAASL